MPTCSMLYYWKGTGEKKTCKTGISNLSKIYKVFYLLIYLQCIYPQTR